MASLHDFYKDIGNGSTPGKPPADPAFADMYPLLYLWLTEDHLGEHARLTGTLTIFVDGGMWKCWVNDRHTGQFGVVSADTAADIPGIIERKMSEGGMDWRPCKYTQRDWTPKNRGLSPKRGKSTTERPSTGGNR